jgi:hypothetical protein
MKVIFMKIVVGLQYNKKIRNNNSDLISKKCKYKLNILIIIINDHIETCYRTLC